MAGIPKVRIQFDADFDELKKGVKGATNEIEGFGSKVGDFAKKAGAAFAIAGVAAAAYAGKLLIDGVKSAIADEAAQAKLATTLKNVAGATNAQIAATEAYILKTSLLTGKTDNELRPSLERLARATGNVTEAQKLQAIAIDVAAGSGKSLEIVSNAIAKSAEGQNTALGKLGIGISSAELKTMSFSEITAKLSSTFKDQASIQAETFAGKMGRLKVAFDEAKETVGSFVLDAITPLVSSFVNNVIPTIVTLSSEIGTKLKPIFQDLSRFLTEVLIPAFRVWWDYISKIVIPSILAVLIPAFDGLKKGFGFISDAIENNRKKLEPLFELFKGLAAFARDVLAPVLGTVLGKAFEVVGKIAGGVITVIANVISGFNTLINGAIAGINLLIRAYNAIPLLPNIPLISVPGASSGLSGGLYGSTPVNGGSTGSTTTSAPMSPAAIAASIGAATSGASSNSNNPALSNIAKIQKDFDKKLVTANKALEAANAASARADALVPISQADLNFRDSFSSSPMNTYNVTVNGALDSESTARQIVDLLNRSESRGTLGAGGLIGAVSF